MGAFVNPALIDSIAHSIDIPKLSSEAAKALAPDVEYKLRELIQDAQKFARHARRLKLTTEDVNNALRMRNAEPLYGFTNKDPTKYLKAAGLTDVYCVEDPDVPVEQLVDRPLPRAPVEVGVMPHWLFINGVQPLTPENTPLEKPFTKSKRQMATAASAQAGVGAAGAKAGATSGGAAPQGGTSEDGKTTKVLLPVQHVVSLELQNYFTKAMDVIQDAVTAGKTGTRVASAGGGVGGQGVQGQSQPQRWGEMGGSGGGMQGAGTTAGTAAVDGTAAAGAGTGAGAGGEGLQGAASEVQLEAVLGSLSTGAGLHPISPYIVKYIADEVKMSLPYAPALLVLLRLVRAILVNTALHLDKYVHQLLPALLTCVVAKGIGCSTSPSSSSTSTSSSEIDAWAVRQAAAKLVSDVCARFGRAHPNVQPRVSKTLLQALLDTGKPLTTHYGAVVGIAALGPVAVRLLLLPQLPAYLDRLQPLLSPPTTNSNEADGGPSAMDVDGGTNAEAGVNGHGVAGPAALKAAQHADAMRVHGALVEATGTALYRLMVDKAAGIVTPDDAASRSSAVALSKVAEAFRPPSQQQEQQQPPVGAADMGDADRAHACAILVMSWREDVPVDQIAWAAGELLGPALTARLPQARPAHESL